jgi:putative oxidoreductase
MFYPIRGLLALAGRILIVAVFLMSAVANKILHFHDVLAVMRAHNVPYAEFLLPGAIIVLIVGSLCVLLGYKARFGAFLLLLFLVAATYYFHNFWDMTNPDQQREQMVHFLKNASMMGTMLFIMAVGAGPFSCDARWTDVT